MPIDGALEAFALPTFHMVRARGSFSTSCNASDAESRFVVPWSQSNAMSSSRLWLTPAASIERWSEKVTQPPFEAISSALIQPGPKTETRSPSASGAWSSVELSTLVELMFEVLLMLLLLYPAAAAASVVLRGMPSVVFCPAQAYLIRTLRKLTFAVVFNKTTAAVVLRAMLPMDEPAVRPAATNSAGRYKDCSRCGQAPALISEGTRAVGSSGSVFSGSTLFATGFAGTGKFTTPDEDSCCENRTVPFIVAGIASPRYVIRPEDPSVTGPLNGSGWPLNSVAE